LIDGITIIGGSKMYILLYKINPEHIGDIEIEECKDEVSVNRMLTYCLKNGYKVVKIIEGREIEVESCFSFKGKKEGN
jgi:Zn finger protein HypA/HybF involved in hydrogenase expression